MMTLQGFERKLSGVIEALSWQFLEVLRKPMTVNQIIHISVDKLIVTRRLFLLLSRGQCYNCIR
jgi:hypothetical protein